MSYERRFVTDYKRKVAIPVLKKKYAILAGHPNEPLTDAEFYKLVGAYDLALRHRYRTESKTSNHAESLIVKAGHQCRVTPQEDGSSIITIVTKPSKPVQSQSLDLRTEFDNALNPGMRRPVGRPRKTEQPRQAPIQAIMETLTYGNIRGKETAMTTSALAKYVKCSTSTIHVYGQHLVAKGMLMTELRPHPDPARQQLKMRYWWLAPATPDSSMPSQQT